MIVIVHQVMRSHFVSTAKAFTVRFALIARKVRMTELVAIIHVKPAVVVEVSPRALDAIVKSLPLGLGQVLRRHIPAAVTILSESGRGLAQGLGKSFGASWPCSAEEKSECRDCKSIESHDWNLLFSRLSGWPFGLKIDEIGKWGQQKWPRRWSLLLRCGSSRGCRLAKQVFEGGADAGFVVAILDDDCSA